MSQKIANIVNLFSQLSNAEKIELISLISHGDNGNRVLGGEGFRNKSGGANTINFAPRDRGTCPSCGR